MSPRASELLQTVLLLTFAVVAHLGLVVMAPGVARALDVFLVVIVLVGLRGRTLHALLWGSAIGLVQDSAVGALYGLHGAAGTLLGYLVARAAQQLLVRHPFVLTLLFVTASLVHQAVVIALTRWFAIDPSAVSIVELTTRALGCAALGVSIHFLVQYWRGWRERRRLSRPDRVMLGVER